MTPENLKKKLDNLYNQYNRRRYVHPDPLEFLYSYKEIREREIVGLIASSLAYGRVAQILKSVSLVLDKMNSSPFIFLKDSGFRSIYNAFYGFKHRFAGSGELAALLFGIKNVINRFGSLHECFLAGFSKNNKNVIPAMTFFQLNLLQAKTNRGILLPCLKKGAPARERIFF